MASILKVENLNSYIGQYTILQGVDIEVKKGEAIAILGRNGAGKSTLLKTIMGLVNTRSGSILLGEDSLVGIPTYDIANKGIGYVPEDYGVFDYLTIAENLKLAIRNDTKDGDDRIAKVYDIFPDLRKASERMARTLSGGQRQMLSISRALVNDNKIILIDEPSKGLAPVVIETLAVALKEISKESTILLVEQNFSLACAIASRYYIINEGRTVVNGKIEDLIQDTQLQATHLGI
ncbi:ABC transporter ATP-binding protein [Sedimentibacter hydroxybenzoicus DSM 7310]|uniref:ABC transporter ATP-binding protein n=1 Tax=Sedimentibacter hydroxybenzoicus DSM 7310 TaxID=1123245 RepID=A0A974BMP9_SEDHY|nr:ABC transporter ATP-binding protein [Sedimentibacter hydroxybenzoicus]NYB75701.1 ABC transporter ATP-binding protein [Sedimentibacter hydroxybenzoicus DSM 7310]